MPVSSSPLMASQTLILTIPSSSSSLSPPNPTSLSLSLSKPTTLTLSPPLRPKSKKLFAFPPSYSPPIPTTQSPLLTGSTRTITTLFAAALSLSKLLASKISLQLGGGIFTNPNTPTTAVGPLFVAAISQVGPRSTGEPLVRIAAGLARWIEIYSCVLLIRVLLSWFPNIQWDKQPMSAIRDLCDPYLSLFRGIIPPLFNSLDVSPILAFLLLGMLGQFARAPR